MRKETFWAIYRLLAFVAIVALSAAGIHEISARQDAIRDASIRACEDGNVRATTFREVIVAALADPPPQTYDWIADKALREGAINSGKESRQRMRAEVQAKIVPRNCRKEYEG